MLSEQAWNFYEQGDYLSAKIEWLRLLDEVDGDDKRVCLSSYCYTLTALGEYESALEILDNLFYETKDHSFLHNKIAVYREMGEWFKALDVVNAEKTLISKANYLALAANLYEEMECFLGLKQTQQAFDLIKQAKCIVELAADEIMWGCYHRVVGDIYLALNQWDNCMEHWALTLEHFRSSGDEISIQQIQKRISFLINVRQELYPI